MEGMWGANMMVTFMFLFWPIFTVICFRFLRPHYAILTVLILGWLFLPVYKYKIVEGIPELSKQSLISYCLILGVFLFDNSRLRTLKISIYDIPMIIFCLSPGLSSLLNLLGIYDALAAAYNSFMIWWVPYLIGRLYFSTLKELKMLVVAFILGSVIYIPFILYEVRMSPQLHNMVYGYHASFFGMTLRGGGYRPQVFMEHGLALGMWLGTSSLLALVMWQANQFKKKFWGFNVRWVIPLLPLVTILQKSTGSIMILFMGIFFLLASRFFSTRIPFIILMVIPVLYVFTRGSGLWNGGQLSALAGMVSAERKQSIDFRLSNEDILSERARESPIYGWAGWGRSRVYDKKGEDISVTDGLWIIVFGTQGVIGIVGLLGFMFIPTWVMLRHFDREDWGDPDVFLGLAVAAILAAYMIDCLLNAMYNPIFLMMIGSLAGVGGAVVSRAKVGMSPWENLVNPEPIAQTRIL